MTTEQEEIQAWFNNTYKKSGFRYLRPVGAYRIFSTVINPKPHSKHLDVACGLGLMLKALELEHTSVELFGIDISDEAAKMAKKYCPTATITVGNAEQLPYADNTFDSLTCIGSLERMIDKEQVLKEVLRVTKTGANICFMVRNAENFTWKYILKPFRLVNKKGHQGAKNLEAWKQTFAKQNLETIDIYPDHWPYYRLIPFFLPWKNINTGKIIRFPFRITLAYEFIFHLRKI